VKKPRAELKSGLDLVISGEDESADRLTPHERRFVDEYFAGDHAGNGTRSYLVVYPEASYSTASVASSELLKSPKVREYLESLYEQATKATLGKLQDWVELLPVAQQVLVATCQGRMRNRLAYEASKYICDRALGSPTASTQVTVRDEAKIIRAVAKFTTRVAEGRRQRGANNEG
jgi:hypothetical protein